jgi:tetrapyrrole methylase family protein / MazG family protein
VSKNITIIGLGAGDENQLTLGLLKKLKSANKLFLRTKEHPVVSFLENEGITYQSFDDVYEKHDRFEDVYEDIAQQLFKQAHEEEIVFAVPGHPMVAESTVQHLLNGSEREGINVSVAGGQSFLDELFTALKIDPNDGCQFVDGTALKQYELQIRQHIIISQVYDAFVASEVKLTLMELLPDDYEVVIVTAAGSSQENIVKVPLHELDRNVTLSNLTSVYVPPVQEEEQLYKDFNYLREVIATLRGPNGCPWDLKQTHKSLKKYLIEECYEVIEAIDEEDDHHLVEELGDVLLQVMLHAQIGEDDGYFSVTDIIEALTEKMIRRHPHVFSDVNVENEEEVVRNWQKIKEGEKEVQLSRLSGVPKSLPALLKATNIQKKAAKVGFDWPTITGAWDKVREEVEEVSEVLGKDKQKEEEELGDLFFALVNVARFRDVDPEQALNRCIQKFEKRFTYIEQEAEKQGNNIETMTLEEMDNLWNEAKKKK